MTAHPGKKLNFMGYEFGQFKEWNYKEGIEFFLRDTYELHGKLSEYVKELNFFYRNTPALYEIEDSWDGFEWLAPDDADRNAVSFIRRDREGREVICLTSYSGVDADDYLLGVNKRGKYRVIFNSDDKKFGGEGKLKKRTFTAVKKPSHGKQYSLQIPLPKLTTLYLVYEPSEPKTLNDKSSNNHRG